jgi:DNA-binding LacI/PurR family transcriptional regulator
MSQKAGTESAKKGPKYKRVYLELGKTLTDGALREGDKLPSESELVARFGVSRPTVRRALAQLVTEGLIERRMGAGTVVSNRSRQKSLGFGLLIPELGTTEIFEPICQGISQAHSRGRHDLIWGPSFLRGASKEVQAEHLCRYYIERKVSGVFFAPMEHFERGDAVNRSIARALDDAEIPIVLLDRDIVLFPERSRYDLVGIDNHRAGFVLAEHLLRTGSRRIAFLASPFSAHTVDARIGGYTEALHVHQGPTSQPLVKWADPGDVSAVQEFLHQAQPDAIICANDFTAAQLLRSLSSIGIQAPAQIRIAGFDDVKYAQLLQTPLTTIRQPCLEIGSAALLAMLDRIAHPAAPAREFIVDFQLVIRKSTQTEGRNGAEPDATMVDGDRGSIGLQSLTDGRAPSRGSATALPAGTGRSLTGM